MTTEENDPKPLNDVKDETDGRVSQTKIIIALEIVFLIVVVYFSIR